MMNDKIEREKLICSICLDDDEDVIATLKPCNHRFHQKCIRQWHIYADDLKCPMCRAEAKYLKINEDDIHQETLTTDLERGFSIKTVVDYQNDESLSELTRNFDNLLYLNDQSSLIRDSRRLYCNICGEECTERGGRCCRQCNLYYHEICLRLLSCEVGDRESWQQCVDCRALVRYISSRFCTNTRNVAPSNRIRDPQLVLQDTHHNLADNLNQVDLDKLLEVKTKIQKHVRDILDIYYQFGVNGIKIDKRHFTEVNKTVSRRLYKTFKYKYQEGSRNYDIVANRQVHIELCKLGYF